MSLQIRPQLGRHGPDHAPGGPSRRSDPRPRYSEIAAQTPSRPPPPPPASRRPGFKSVRILGPAKRRIRPPPARAAFILRPNPPAHRRPHNPNPPTRPPRLTPSEPPHFPPSPPPPTRRRPRGVREAELPKRRERHDAGGESGGAGVANHVAAAVRGGKGKGSWRGWEGGMGVGAVRGNCG